MIKFNIILLLVMQAYCLSAQVKKHAFRVIGQPNFDSSQFNQGGTAGANTLNNPSQMLVMNGKFLISDAINNRVLIFDSIPGSDHPNANMLMGQLNYTSILSNRGGTTSSVSLDRPAGLATDGTRLFVLDRDNHRVLIFNKMPDSINTPADLVIGQPNMNLRQYGGESALNDTLNLSQFRLSSGPTGLAYDPISGRLVVCDSDNDRILIYNQIPDTNGAPADVVIGQRDFTHNKTNQGGIPGANTFDLSTAEGVSIHNGKLFVADRLNNRVLIFNSLPDTNNAMADVVIGQADFNSNLPNRGGSRNSNTLSQPRSVTVDAYGRMYIADNANARILVYNQVPTSNGVAADKVIGQNDFLSGSPSVSDSTFRSIYQIMVHGNTLMVSDAANHRVIFFEIEEPVGLPKYKSSEIKFYPNPAASKINLAIPAGLYTFKVFNLSGQLMHSGKASETSIDVSALGSGMYFVEINGADNRYYLRFVKE